MSFGFLFPTISSLSAVDKVGVRETISSWKFKIFQEENQSKSAIIGQITTNQQVAIIINSGYNKSRISISE